MTSYQVPTQPVGAGERPRFSVLPFLAALLAVMIAAAALYTAYEARSHSNSTQTTLSETQQSFSSYRSAATSALSADNAEIKSLRTTVGGLSSQVQNLNVPSDPLSAYNEVCTNSDVQTSNGGSETVYYPCTNQAQTTPQPGD